MQFKLAALAAVVSVVSYAQAERTSGDVVKDLKEMTDIAQDNHLMVSSINSHTVMEKAPEMVHHYYMEIELLNKELKNMHQSGPDEAGDVQEQAELCEAWREFTVVNGHLLEKTIEKRQELRMAEYQRKIAGIVHALYEGFYVLARDTITLVPTCADNARSDYQKLDLSLRRAMGVFYYR
ncbi:hypothetical protein F4810DRAFT_441325 [Camillea tinctor]|nr:hypothetical protein F4810DRAFT_441325 [Camillea tinctor]